MKTAPPNLPPKHQSLFLLIFATLIGGWLRFTPALMTGFPVNDGGMFAVAIEAILKNGFALPLIIPYNQLQIPFAYPPLPFYAAAILGNLFHIQTPTLLMWIPAAMATLCIPAVFWLALTLTRDSLKAAGASLLYALLPGASAWLVMGGGLTRAFGMFFLLLTVNSACAVFLEDRREHTWQAALWGSLTVLSHPEMSLHAAGLAAGLLIFSRRWKNVPRALAIAAGVAALTSPWWGITLARYGMQPFIQASRLSERNLLWILQQLGFLQLTGEKLFPIIGALGLLGLGTLLARRQYLLPGLIVIPYLVNQRNAGTVAVVFLCMAATTALLDLILPGLEHIKGRQNAAITGFAIYVGFFLLLAAYLGVLQQSQAVVSTENRQAMIWASHNTPETGRFLVLTGNEHLFYDPSMEWFPVFANRQSVGTLQGREWQFGDVFYTEMSRIQAAQQCYFQDNICLEEKAKALSRYDYLYLTKTCAGQTDCALPAGQDAPLILLLRQADEKYRLVFENKAVVIFAVK